MIIERLRILAKTQPEKSFLIGQQTLTYAETVSEIEQLTALFPANAQRSPVIIQGSNTVNWMLGLLAARMAGLVAIPLPEDLSVEAFLPIVGSCYQFDTLQGGVTLIGVSSPPIFPEQAAFCLPTSGSTGNPRLALRSEHSFLAEGKRYIRSLNLQANEQILLMLPLAHAFALGIAVGITLGVGGTLQLMPRFSPRTAQKLLSTGDTTLLPLVPAMARLLCETFQRRGFQPPPPRNVLIGAGRVTDSLAESVRSCFGRLPALGYGSSEMGGVLGTVGEAVAADVTGQPLSNVEVALTPANGVEALFIRTETPFLGYLTTQGIDASSVSPDGWYATGDFATRDDAGYLSIRGRLGQGLRRGGKWIQPVEVQNALQEHPVVREAIVRGEQDEHGEDVVVAHVETTLTDPVELSHFLQRRLAAYKIPTRWQLYTNLPRTSGGKPARDQLRTGQPSDGMGCSAPTNDS